MQLDLFGEASAAGASPSKARRGRPGPSKPATPGNIATPASAVAATTSAPLAVGEESSATPDIVYLSDVLAHYSDAVNDHPERRRFRSALSTLERVLRRPLDQLPANIQELRPALTAANPAVVGVTPVRWRDVRYILKRALNDLGVPVVSLRDETPLTSEWAALHGRLSDRKLTIGLSKFLRFCSRTGVTPAGMTSSAFDSFRDELETRSLHDDPAAVVRQTKKLWNRAVKDVTGWPPTIVATETNPHRYSLPWDAFPDSFQADVEAFLAEKANRDEFSPDYRQQVRTATRTSRRQALRCLASGLVLSGTSSSELTSLGVLCRIENVRSALAYIRDREGAGELTPGHRNYAYLLLIVARHWLKDTSAEKEIATLLQEISSKVGVGRGGIKPKNRERLRQFDIIENHQTLIALPEKVRREVARKSNPTRLDSARLMYGLMVAILLRVPMRLRNLVELELGVSITQIGKGRRRQTIIHFQGGLSTKTGEPYEAPLSSDVNALLDEWLKIHRMRISPKPSAYLFPSPKGTLRNRSGVGVLLSRFIQRETGLVMHPHLFRHLAAKTILDHDPSQMETARRVLGHTSVRTTERAYAEMQNAPAFRALDDNLAQMRTLPVRGRRRRRAP